MSNSTSMLQARLSVEQTAAYLGLSKSTLDKLRVFGGGPAYAKLGRRVTYSQQDIDRWVAGKQRLSTSHRETTAQA